MSTLDLQIPDKYEEGFVNLLKLSKNQFNKLEEYVLNYTAPYSEEKIQKLSDDLKLEPFVTKKILQTVGSFYVIKDKKDVNVEDIADALIKALNSKKEERFSPPPNFKEWLIKILINENEFFLEIKAKHLAFEREKILTNIKIITDIRPIEYKNIKDSKYFTIIHNLSIEYFQAEERKEVYIALDIKDLFKLKDEIIKAEKMKENILDNFKNNSSFKIINS
jgi:hypothetical protein